MTQSPAEGAETLPATEIEVFRTLMKGPSPDPTSPVIQKIDALCDMALRAEKAERELAGALQYGQMYEDAARERNAAEAELAGAKRDALEQAAKICQANIDFERTASHAGSFHGQYCQLVLTQTRDTIRAAMQSDRAQEGSK